MCRVIFVVVLLIAGYKCDVAETNPKSAINDQFEGDILLQMGKTFENPLLRLLGKTLNNLEIKMKKDEKDKFSDFCKLFPCSDWSLWSECPATMGEFSMITRSRTCGLESSLCRASGQNRTETQSRVCQTTCEELGFNLTSSGFCLKIFPSNTLNKEEAISKCHGLESSVINLDSDLKTNDTLFLLSKYGLERQTIWLNGQRKDVYSEWILSDGSTMGNYSHWSGGEPSNGGDELCMVEEIKSNGRYWFDRSCTSDYYVICEQK